MTKKLLHESSQAPVKAENGRWRAVLITPGQGSSANYSEAALERSVPAFVAGTKNWFMHPEKAGEQRDPRNQWGFIPESVKYEPGVGITAEIQVLNHWKPVIDSLAEAGQASLSIWAMGESDEDGNLIELLPDTQNSVDLVAYPGRPGSGLTEKLYESALAGSVKPAVEASAEEKEGKMEKVILEAIAALDTKLNTFVTESKDAAKAEFQAEADANAIESAVKEALATYSEKLVAIDAADLFPKQAAALRAEAAKGVDTAPLLAQAIEFAAEAKGLISEDAGAPAGGRVVESGGAPVSASAALPKGW